MPSIPIMKKNAVILILITIVVIFLLGISAGIQSNTIIEWWKPVAASAVIALAGTAVLHKVFRPIFRNKIKYLEYPIAFAVIFSIILCGLYSTNYFMSDPTTRHEYSVPVVNKYSKERYRTKRVGRRTVRGEKYMTYYIQIKLPDGQIKSYNRPVGEYVRIKRGQKLKISVEEGLYGVPVIKKRPGINFEQK